jgi:hypothetical protein
MLSIYTRLSVREKTLIIGFLWVLILVWGFGSTGRMSQSISSINQQKNRLKGQEELIKREPQIDSDLKALQDKFDPEKTYNREELFQRLEEMAKGMDPTIKTLNSQEGEIFNVHSVEVRVRDASIELLVSFGDNLLLEPYISLERAKINSDKKNPVLLDAIFEISAFELKKQQSP